jgi:hypothetical protein
MAKKFYKIPTALDKNALDMEITLQNKEGVGLKPLTLKVISCYIVSAFMLIFMVMKSFMANSGALLIPFVIVWIWLTYLLVGNTKTGDLAYTKVIAAFRYFGRANRYCVTRKQRSAKPFYYLMGIRDIDEQSGLIEFLDGSFGSMYRVVGSASALLFEDDKEAILDRVDNFYRKMGFDVEIIKITTKESQKIYHQAAYLKEQYDNLQNRDPELLQLQEEKFQILKHHVGEQYRSIHQYMILKADNAESLRVAVNLLLAEVESSTLMIKQCTHSIGYDIDQMMESIYKEQ